MKFKLLLLPLMILISTSVFAEPVKDTPLNAYIAGGLQSTGETIQTIAELAGVEVNPQAKKSVDTIKDTFKDNKELFVIGAYTAPITPTIANKTINVTVNIIKRPPPVVNITHIIADTVEEAISSGTSNNVAKMAEQGLTQSVGVK